MAVILPDPTTIVLLEYSCNETASALVGCLSHSTFVSRFPVIPRAFTPQIVQNGINI